MRTEQKISDYQHALADVSSARRRCCELKCNQDLLELLEEAEALIESYVAELELSALSDPEEEVQVCSQCQSQHCIGEGAGHEFSEDP